MARSKEKRRMRDRDFISLDWDKHKVRLFALAGNTSSSFDLFPPSEGYRQSGSKYRVSPARQLNDWANLIKERDNYSCQKCGSTNELEAHHLWSKSSFHHLRYLPNNGVTLCRNCHYAKEEFSEITFNQFSELVSDQDRVNANLEREDFWSYYTAGLEKGRILLFGFDVDDENFYKDIDKQLEHFYEIWSLNNRLKLLEHAAQHPPFRDPDYSLNQKIVSKIKSYSIN